MYASAAGVWLAMKSTVSRSIAVNPVTEIAASGGARQRADRRARAGGIRRCRALLCDDIEHDDVLTDRPADEGLHLLREL